MLLLRLVPALLFVLLALFAWRGWKGLPTLARLAAVLTFLLGLRLLKTPGALTAAVLLTCALGFWVSARKR